MLQSLDVSPKEMQDLMAFQAPYVARIRVRVAHGVPLVRAGIGAFLAGTGEFDVVAAHASNPTDVLVADLDFGLRALETRSAQHVLIIALDDGEAMIRKALGMGVSGLLLHTCGADELTAAVRTVSSGGTAFSPCVANRIVHSFASEPLTDRELEVLQLMVRGCSDKDMARQLVIALGTVKSHMKSILTKLGAARRTEAAAIAQRRGITRLDSPMHRADTSGIVRYHGRRS
jgi:DNA-binding NarL/FixJ family response regulator